MCCFRWNFVMSVTTLMPALAFCAFCLFLDFSLPILWADCLICDKGASGRLDVLSFDFLGDAES